MPNLFGELNQAAEKQRQEVQKLEHSPTHNQDSQAQETRPIKVAQKSERMSNRASEKSHKPMIGGARKQRKIWVNEQVNAEAIEDLAYKYRRSLKNKLNTEIPEGWKKKLDGVALELGVGKYDLLMYIIGVFLREVEENET